MVGEKVVMGIKQNVSFYLVFRYVKLLIKVFTTGNRFKVFILSILFFLNISKMLIVLIILLIITF